MRTLQVIRLKPNPAGKDRNRSGATPSQLGGEWVDFRNTGLATTELAGVDLYHLAFTAGESQGRWERVTPLAGRLESGRILRVHAGRFRDLSILKPEDLAGADLHTFTGDDAYVWNNREGDTALLWLPASSSEIDRAPYEANPPEGVTLVRVGTKLVPEYSRVGVRL